MAAITLVSTLYFQKFYTIKAPLLLVINKEFYRSTPKNAFLWEFITHIPRDGRIMTMNHMGLALSKYDVYPPARNMKELRHIDPKYIAYDLRDGQNANNFFPATEDSWKYELQILFAQESYKIIYQHDQQFILEKVN